MPTNPKLVELDIVFHDGEFYLTGTLRNDGDDGDCNVIVYNQTTDEWIAADDRFLYNGDEWLMDIVLGTFQPGSYQIVVYATDDSGNITDTSKLTLLMPEASFECIDSVGENWCYLKPDTTLYYPGDALTVGPGTEIKATARIRNTLSDGPVSLWVKDETVGEWLCSEERYVEAGNVSTFSCNFNADWAGTHEVKFYARHRNCNSYTNDEELDSFLVEVGEVTATNPVFISKFNWDTLSNMKCWVYYYDGETKVYSAYVDDTSSEGEIPPDVTIGCAGTVKNTGGSGRCSVGIYDSNGEYINGDFTNLDKDEEWSFDLGIGSFNNDVSLVVKLFNSDSEETDSIRFDLRIREEPADCVEVGDGKDYIQILALGDLSLPVANATAELFKCWLPTGCGWWYPYGALGTVEFGYELKKSTTTDSDGKACFGGVNSDWDYGVAVKKDGKVVAQGRFTEPGDFNKEVTLKMEQWPWYYWAAIGAGVIAAAYLVVSIVKAPGVTVVMPTIREHK